MTSKLMTSDCKKVTIWRFSVISETIDTLNKLSIVKITFLKFSFIRLRDAADRKGNSGRDAAYFLIALLALIVEE
jgi:hypothetical protein